MPMDWLNTPVDVPISELIARKKRARMIEMLRSQLEGRLAPGVQVRLQLADLLVQAGRGDEAVPVLIGLADEFDVRRLRGQGHRHPQARGEGAPGPPRRGLAPRRPRAAAAARGPRRRAPKADRARRSSSGSRSSTRRRPPDGCRRRRSCRRRERGRARWRSPEASLAAGGGRPGGCTADGRRRSASAACSTGSSPRCRTLPEASGAPIAATLAEPAASRRTRGVRGTPARAARTQPPTRRSSCPKSTSPLNARARGRARWRCADRRCRRAAARRPRDHAGARPRRRPRARRPTAPRGAVRGGLRGPPPRHRGGRAPAADAGRRAPSTARASSTTRIACSPRRCSPTSPTRSCWRWCAGCACTPSSAGDVIVTEREPGQSLFILTSGRVKVFVRNPAGRNYAVAQLREGDFFGEIASLSGRPRTATVVAAAITDLLELDKPTLDGIARTHPRVCDVLEDAYIGRASSPEAAAIRAVPLNDPLSDQRAIEVLEAHFGESRWDPRMRLRLADVLVRAGKDEDAVPDPGRPGRRPRARGIPREGDRHPQEDRAAPAPAHRGGEPGARGSHEEPWRTRPTRRAPGRRAAAAPGAALARPHRRRLPRLAARHRARRRWARAHAADAGGHPDRGRSRATAPASAPARSSRASTRTSCWRSSTACGC